MSRYALPTRRQDDTLASPREKTFVPLTRKTALLVVIVAVSLVVAGLLGWGIGRSTAPTAEAGITGGVVLPADPSREWPREHDIHVGAHVRHADFYSMKVGTVLSDSGDPRENHCLLIVDRGSVNGSCSPRGFEALVDILVDERSPEPLRAEFEEGTVVRITYDGQEVIARANDR